MGRPGVTSTCCRTRATEVPCVAGSGCTYSLDVSGGWYDAGDHGKYVVNAGISVWTLLNWWERTKHLDPSDLRPPISATEPEHPREGQRRARSADEVRWELEFELRMQVPKERSWRHGPPQGA